MKRALMESFDDHTSPIERTDISRRRFVQLTGLSALGISTLAYSKGKNRGVSLVIDPTDTTAGAPPSQWAIAELAKALTSAGIAVHRCKRLAQAQGGDIVIVIGGSDHPMTRAILKQTKTQIPAVAEALGLIPAMVDDRKVVLACGSDVRGLVYALLELADSITYAQSPVGALNLRKPVVEQPANVIRSLNKLFVSEIEDKPWFYDREMWTHYLTMAATQRFNRFNLSMGIGYDFLQNVTDAYFLFAYPFLLSVPGYAVKVPQLPDTERDRNLQTLKYISEQTAARGMHFQLGLWMHGHEWLNSPHPNYTIEGLTPENKGQYCRDAVRLLLQSCPAISGITFRTHGESGVNEGSYNFWKMVFDGVATCGRTVEIDLHAKGIDQTMIDNAVATGMPVNVSPKYWAEHLGMPYHQTDIRAYEIPKPGSATTELMKLSAGSRSFIRYGYGDLLKEARRYGVLHRIWPGTQRLLLWGDPVMSAAHSRTFGFCGSAGVELMEPLSFKGRRGSGIAGGRCGYADASLTPMWDWEKYLYSLRVFGRLAYNPTTAPDVWRRYLVAEFGSGAEAVEQALANASRILPIVLTVHGVSAANALYWVEMYTNLSIADPENKNLFFDTPSPKVFGNVSPMDPQLFLGINEYVKGLLGGEACGKYTPIEYAQWIEDLAEAATRHLAQAAVQSRGKQRPEFRRMEIDVAIQAGLGRFFGAKFRAGVLYSIFEQSGDITALKTSIQLYSKARGFWADLANRARGVYKADVTLGDDDVVRGHWLDRLPAIDADIELMKGHLERSVNHGSVHMDKVQAAMKEAMGRPIRESAVCRHQQQEHYTAGEPLVLELSTETKLASARLYYRHVNHAERFVTVDMHVQDEWCRTSIPGDYTHSPYPLQYYFELKGKSGKAWLYPGFTADQTNQPYFVVRKA
jgi:hypothetical protein